MAGLWDAQRTRRRPRHRRLAARHRGEHALVLRDLDARTATGSRDRVADSGHQSLVPAQNFPTARRLDRRLLQQGEVLGGAGRRAGAARARRAIRASPPSPIASPTRTRCCRSSRRASPSARPRTWLARLRGRVPCAPVNTVAQALADEQVRAREMILEVEHPRFGLLREVASPVKTAGAITRPAPAPAAGRAHRRRSCANLLQYDPARIAAAARIGRAGRAPAADARAARRRRRHEPAERGALGLGEPAV